MREIVYALIRRRIRTLFPEPFALKLVRHRGFQAAALTVGIYTLVFVGLSLVEIRPTRSVDLYPELTVTMAVPTDIEDTDEGAVTASSDSTEGRSGSSEDGFSPNTGPALEQIEGGSEDTTPEETADAAPEGFTPSSPLSHDAKKADTKITLEQKKPESKPKPKPPPEEIPEEPAVEEPEQPEPEPEPEPETAPEEDAEPDKEPAKPVGPHDEKTRLGGSRRNIVPAYIIDRRPRIEYLAEAAFPDGYEEQALERTSILRVVLDADGEVVRVEPLSSGGFDFDDAAINAVLRSEFTPAHVGTQAVPCAMVVEYEFRSYYEEEGS